MADLTISQRHEMLQRFYDLTDEMLRIVVQLGGDSTDFGKRLVKWHDACMDQLVNDPEMVGIKDSPLHLEYRNLRDEIHQTILKLAESYE